MAEDQLLTLIDNVISLGLLLLVWSLERKRSERLETKNDNLTQVFIDDHKARRGSHDPMQ